MNYELDLQPGFYRVEFFKNPVGADPSGYGEGQAFASAVVVNHPGTGRAIYSTTFAGNAGNIVTATTTFCADATLSCTTPRSTSEFSPAVSAVTTAVKLMSFTAVGRDQAVDLAWQTGSELANLGFHVYRSASSSGPWTRITSSLIPGLGSSPIGQSYSWRDPGLVNGQRYYYRLEDVDAHSVSTFHGPVSAVPQADPHPSGEGGGSGSGRLGTSATTCPGWVLSAYGCALWSLAASSGASSPSSPTCQSYGDPAATSLHVLSHSSPGRWWSW